jgi:hypothetical protein
MTLFLIDRAARMFLFCSQGVKPTNPPFQAALERLDVSNRPAV